MQFQNTKNGHGVLIPEVLVLLVLGHLLFTKLEYNKHQSHCYCNKVDTRYTVLTQTFISSFLNQDLIRHSHKRFLYQKTLDPQKSLSNIPGSKDAIKSTKFSQKQ